MPDLRPKNIPNLGPEWQLNQLVWILAALGFAWVLGSQIASIRTADRTVQVRGAAEVLVHADVATWALGVIAYTNDLATAQAQINESSRKIRQFLVTQGIPEADLSPLNMTVSDARANQENYPYRGPRFRVQGGLLLRTTALTPLQAARNNLGTLVSQGVVLSSGWGPQYAFTKLDEVKPKLLSQSTAAAHTAAQQFAADSGVRLGGIRQATQGKIEVLGRDDFTHESAQPEKRLRLVTTIRFDLH
jgi:hypothetical protein